LISRDPKAEHDAKLYKVIIHIYITSGS
jgi:hypothetical protein